MTLPRPWERSERYQVMTNDQARQLCLSLMKADTEDVVIGLLRDAGYWDERAVWRYYGDCESNFSTIYNQASRSDAALVEKIVNSVDARLLNESLVSGVDPEGPSAPRTMRDAVARFFEHAKNAGTTKTGRIREWSEERRTQEARSITISATGYKPTQGNPCFTVADAGEGQTPRSIPSTFLSLPFEKSNKTKIPFVQGNFNMGGSGVLRFCGRHHLQLILSRRNPELVRSNDPSDREWGFTVVRREDAEGQSRHSIFTYLAPLGHQDKPGHGEVLRFRAERMPLFPEGRDAYGRDAAFGTLIKLYEYDATGYKSNIIMRGGLLRRLDLLLPEMMLPARLYECRYEEGPVGSYSNTLAGLSVRLGDNKSENLEPGFPESCQLTVGGEPMAATIYALKKGTAETYRKNEGIIFTVNGQTHGTLTVDFFRRKQVGLSLLAESIIVIVDCSRISGRAREDLFMNSRDRLSNGRLRVELEEELEELLHHHQGLRELKERRKREEIQSQAQDARPLEAVLENLIKQHRTLADLFMPGMRAANPFKPTKVRNEEKAFVGKRYPTFFKFKDKPYGTELFRNCPSNSRSRIVFETDAEKEYFRRDVDPGEFTLHRLTGTQRMRVENYTINPHDGAATLSLRLPTNCEQGDKFTYLSTLTDATQLDPFVNQFVIEVLPPEEPRTRTSGNGRNGRPGKQEGTDADAPSGIQLPEPILVYEKDYPRYGFTGNTALKVVHDLEEDTTEHERDTYRFYINMDNVHLNRYLKYEVRPGDSEGAIRQRFQLGLLMVGLALLHQDNITKKMRTGEEEEQEPRNIEDHVRDVTSAIAPFLLPMIESLGALEADEEVAMVNPPEVI